MREKAPTSPNIEYFAAAYGIGAPGGAAFVVLSWWLLTGTLDPSVARQDWEHTAIAIHVLTTGLWAPLLFGIASLRLLDRLGWDDPPST